MIRNIQKYYEEYVISPFEEEMADLRRAQVLDFIREKKLVNIVEVGCGNRSLFNSLDHFESFTIIEPCVNFAKQATQAAREHYSAHKIKVANALYENFTDLHDADCIIFSGLLHEIASPEALISHAFDLAREDCWLHVNVPNAKSFHRILAVEAGLIKDIYEKSSSQIRLMQNHTFDCERLTELVQNAGFEVADSGSYFIKPFTHAQMQQLQDLGLLTDALLKGLCGMAKFLPEMGAEIFVNARKPKTVGSDGVAHGRETR